MKESETTKPIYHSPKPIKHKKKIKKPKKIKKVRTNMKLFSPPRPQNTNTSHKLFSLIERRKMRPISRYNTGLNLSSQEKKKQTKKAEK